MKWIIQNATGLRAFLLRQLPLPEWRLRALLEKGCVSADGRTVRRDVPLAPGTRVEVRLPKAFLPKVPVLFEGRSFLVVEKPRGIEVCDSETGALTLDEVLRLMGYEDALPCHRLDTHTGGVMLFARGEAAEAASRELFESHELKKQYLAVCTGAPGRPSGDVRAFLVRRDGKSRITDRPQPGAIPIETAYRILAQKEGLGLAEVGLVTGRTHQIRAHFASWGCPLLGDDLYGDRDANRAWKVRYPCLWAVSLTFPDGLSGPLAELSGRTFTSRPQFPARITELFGLEEDV